MFFKKFEDGKAVGNLITLNNLQYVLTHLDFSSVNGSPDFWEGQGYALMTTTEKPSATIYQYVEEIDSVKIEDGTWQQQWAVREKPAAEKKKLFDDQMVRMVHMKENKIMFCDDFIAAPEYNDVVIDLIHYKEALERVDLSDPYNVVWPPEPHENTGIKLPF
jgi:hypothetical protein